MTRLNNLLEASHHGFENILKEIKGSVSAPSIIRAGVRVGGTFTLTSDVQIDGRIDGDTRPNYGFKSMSTIKSQNARNIVIVRRLEWDAMHRIPEHEGKCAAFHGHRYVLEIAVSGPKLDYLGRIIDFSVIKTSLGQWIDRHFDHTAIMFKDDPAAALVIPYNLAAGRPVYLLNSMPTVENIVIELANIATELLEPYGIEVITMQVWETPNCSAIWTSKSCSANPHLPDVD